jgi:hypothetical protein
MSLLPSIVLPLMLALGLCARPAAQGEPAPQPPAAPAQGEPAPAEPAPVEVQVAPQEDRSLAFEGALVGAKDGEGFADTPSYRRLLELVARYTEEELVAKAQRELDHAGALQSPDAWRGELVHVRGLAAGIQAVRFPTPLGSYTDVYRAIVTEADGSEGVVVDFLIPPPKIEIQRDVIEVEGVFYRTVQYENKKGALTNAPYLIGRSLRKLPPESLPGRTAMDLGGKILVGAVVLFVLLRLILTVHRARARRKAAKAA